MHQKKISIVLALALAGLVDEASAQPKEFPYVSDLTNPDKSVTIQKDQIEQFEELSSPFTHAVQLKGREGIAYITPNGRFIMRGVIFDTWTNSEIQTMDQLRASRRSVSLSELGLKDEDVDPIYYGTGLKEVTVFLDPLCPWCKQFLQQIVSDTRFARDFTFTIYTVPFLGDESTKAVTAISCAPNREEALRALLTHDVRWMKSQPAPEDCDPQPIIQRTILSQMIGVTGVPYIIGAEGGISKGMPSDLWNFLQTN